MTKRSPIKRQFYKTKMCPMLINTGGCSKGENCSFAHSQAELRPEADLRCTKLCRSVEEGFTCDTDNCPFAHCREELRATVEVRATKSCPEGKDCRIQNCRFGHDETDPREYEECGTRTPSERSAYSCASRDAEPPSPLSQYREVNNQDSRAPHRVVDATGSSSSSSEEAVQHAVHLVTPYTDAAVAFSGFEPDSPQSRAPRRVAEATDSRASMEQPESAEPHQYVLHTAAPVATSHEVDGQPLRRLKGMFYATDPSALQKQFEGAEPRRYSE